VINQQELHEILDYNPDTGEFFWKKKMGSRAMPGQSAGWKTSEGYIEIKIFGRAYKRARLAWLHVHGDWPEPCIDHINRNRSDDRLCNLRPANISQNNWNSKVRKDNNSGCRGVSKHGEKYVARISHEGKPIYIGIFETLSEASEAYTKTANELRGQFIGQITPI